MQEKEKLSRSEAGKLGVIISNEISLLKTLKRIENYNSNPFSCQECKSNLPYEKRHNKFCNHSCSAQFNNRLRGNTVQNNISTIKIPKPKKYYNICTAEFSSKSPITIHCSLCVKNKAYKITVQNTKDISVLKTDRARRKFLIKNHEIKCFVCNNVEWNNKPIPIELDHIDGNSDNNLEENLRLICPNCHAQTDTYKNKNMGKGRTKRMKRYNEGKTF